jgi:perosamine synthetase
MRVPAASIVFSEDDIKEALSLIESSLRSGQLTLGKHGQALEEAFAARCGRRFAVAVSSGTSAIEIVLRTLNVEGREVIVPDNTFFATASAVAHAGGIPVLADADRETLAISVDDVIGRITDKTDCVVIVHIGGIVSPELPRLEEECKKRGIFLMCDAAHAHGATLNGKDASDWGVASTYSFYPTKVMTSGEGGMIVTDDDDIAEEARVYRDQGKGSFHANFHTRMGANWRMSEPHAAIVLSQLHRLDEFIERRQVLAARYDDSVGALGLGTLSIPAAASSNYYKYVVFLPEGIDRTAFKQFVRAEYDIGLSGEVYDTPLHHQPVFSQLDDRALPGAEWLCARHVCLPLYPALAEEDVDYVVESLASALEHEELHEMRPGRISAS